MSEARELERAYVDVMRNAVYVNGRGLRLKGAGNRAPSWAKAAYRRFGDGTARGLDFSRLCRAARGYVTNVLGWREVRYDNRGAFLACSCGLNVRGGHPPDSHEAGCVLREVGSDE